MLTNYLKTAFRSLWRSKSHTFINVMGLSLGIACCILIALFVNDEWTFDAFHSKADRIYRVYARENWGKGQEFFYTQTPFPMGPALKENFQEVQAHVRINNFGAQVKVNDNRFTESITIAGQDFFSVFDFNLINGNGNTALKNQSAVIITEKMAKKYFGESNAMDQTISLQIGEQFYDFTVKGVAANLPTNSSIQFDLLISDLNYPKLFDHDLLTSVWFNIIPETYVLLEPNVNPKALEAKFPPVFKTLLGEKNFNESHYAPGLQPLTSIHLDTSYPVGMAPVSNPRYSIILASIAALILLVGSINFITLSLGRSLKRAKEVGIRKVVGAQKIQLITQFIGEAIIITLASLALGTILALYTVPAFNDLSGKQLVFPFDGFLATIMFILLVVIGIVAGSYPAFVLSGFQPISILKGNTNTTSNKFVLRKVLVGVQLSLSIFLIASTLVMKGQLNFLQEKDLGFDREQMVVVPLNVPDGGNLVERVNRGFEKAELFKSELGKIPGVAAVCASSHDFGNGNWTNVGFTDQNGVYRTFDLNVVDASYFSTLKIPFVEGRGFAASNLSDKNNGVIVNEAFAAMFGWKDAVGKRIPGKRFGDHEIIGVAKDFHYTSLYTKVQPLVIVQNANIIMSGVENISITNSPLPKLFIKLQAGTITPSIDKIKAVWNKLTGEEEFGFSFVDQALAKQYRSEQQLSKIVNVATLLAVLIGSLGLYGLASLAMQYRVKEIGIRKVLGATEQSLLMLLSREYIFMIIICTVIATPATYYLMNQWLTSFEYRIDIGANVFLLAGAISLLIACCTIGYKTMRVALTRPAETLKHE